MNTVYFGEPWDVPALEGAKQMPTPVGEKCLWCSHEVQEGERGYIRPSWLDNPGRIELLPAHRGCDLANTSGHLFGVCSCTGFADYWDRNVELERRKIFG